MAVIPGGSSTPLIPSKVCNNVLMDLFFKNEGQVLVQLALWLWINQQILLRPYGGYLNFISMSLVGSATLRRN